MTEWQGEERRGIPIHVLNYVDEKLEIHTQRVERLMSEHVGEEMSRYAEIISLIQDKDQRSEERHHNLVQSITAYMGKVELINTAFLEDQKGNPDYRGHRNDHDKRKQFGEWWGGVKDKAITKVVEWGALAFVVWILHSLWEAFLKGPNK